jgi:hypothetical protein
LVPPTELLGYGDFRLIAAWKEIEIVRLGKMEKWRIKKATSRCQWLVILVIKRTPF